MIDCAYYYVVLPTTATRLHCVVSRIRFLNFFLLGRVVAVSVAPQPMSMSMSLLPTSSPPGSPTNKKAFLFTRRKTAGNVLNFGVVVIVEVSVRALVGVAVQQFCPSTECNDNIDDFAS